MIRTDSILKALDIDTDRYPVLSGRWWRREDKPDFPDNGRADGRGQKGAYNHNYTHGI